MSPNLVHKRRQKSINVQNHITLKGGASLIWKGPIAYLVLLQFPSVYRNRMSVPYMFGIAGFFAVAHLKAGNTRCLPVPKACQAKLRPGNNHTVVAMDLTSHSSSRTGQLCWHTTRLEAPFRLQYQNLKGLKKGGGKQNSQSGSPVAHQRNDAEPLQNIIKRHRSDTWACSVGNSAFLCLFFRGSVDSLLTALRGSMVG